MDLRYVDEIERLRKENDRLKSAADQRKRTGARVYANKRMSEFSGKDKADFIVQLNHELKQVFKYTNETKRLCSMDDYKEAAFNFSRAAEEWSTTKSGNRWLVNAITPVSRDPAKDSPYDAVEVVMVHKGFIRKKSQTHEPTPEPVDIFMTVKINRYELKN